MKALRPLRWTAAALLALLAAAFLVASAANSERLDAVTVRFTGPGAEPQDATLLGFGKDHLKPDYRLDLVHARGTFRCGTILNSSAADGLRFVVSGDIPLRRVQELKLWEEDQASDDLVARVQFAPPAMTSSGYAITTESSRSFAVGVAWFFDTALGKAIAAGITLAIILLVLFLIAQ